jgi:hypothetical protein
MAINRVLAPNGSHTGPNNLSEIIAQLAALVNDKEQPARISGSNVLAGAFFNIGGALYLADGNVAISGTASDYVKLTPSGATAAASFVANLTGVTWNATYKGYYDGSGNLYVFNEAKAFTSGAIASISNEALARALSLLQNGAAGVYGTQAIANPGAWLIPKGAYMMSCAESLALNIQDDVPAAHLGTFAGGFILSDGVKFYLTNLTGGTKTVFYRKLF